MARALAGAYSADRACHAAPRAVNRGRLTDVGAAATFRDLLNKILSQCCVQTSATLGDETSPQAVASAVPVQTDVDAAVADTCASAQPRNNAPPSPAVLNVDLMGLVLSKLSFRDFVSSSAVCKAWNEASWVAPVMREQLELLTYKKLSDSADALCEEMVIRRRVRNNMFLGRAKVRFLTGHTDDVLRTAESPSGRWLVSADMAGNVCMWRADADYALAYRFMAHDSGVCCLAFGNQSRYLLTVGISDNSARVWELADSKARLLWTLTSQHSLSCAAMSSDFQYIAVGGVGRFELWRTHAPTPLWSAASDRVHEVYFNTQPHEVFAILSHGVTELWDFRTLPPGRTSGPKWLPMVSQVFSLERDVAAFADDGAASTWKMHRMIPHHLHESPPMAGHTGQIMTMRMSDDAKVVYTGSADQRVGVWDFAA